MLNTKEEIDLIFVNCTSSKSVLLFFYHYPHLLFDNNKKILSLQLSVVIILEIRWIFFSQ